MPAKITMYQDKRKEFRATVTAGNNRKLANLGESYKTRSGVKNAVKRLQKYMPDSKVVDKTK
ncbi:hypothetical protein A2422_01405 [Candidatus Woesebacteria bacterium RIFOXYC1_FULL_31_51]|uniref:DUF1508 domain-containing protein n=1 Tax=Candidatus Woesebacteria bacterium GW2011_GWC2_31_9 TaxID=1618586 RepID=A0A0F9YHT3_9BACT|nr:MAG: hypothetical protein UR11_C0002G0040 [Candidatus Woesebacteria bacterium GW2011_GWC1_30_29]KKP26908.1 MAG: hypothetical protein UR13_C0001G0003 [Candidatus Woesebacteria bacterium GW2011_GWD1_31_12]KKP27183.1 MAG: hypothetical protein UR16_C0006G0072 [Candidatus Woesebacteria bacterium GW2011_GWB1_31_29]KKP30973.1 MAG: hypothetical protein UR21_C0019G0019 [Candidatus Woesebacteria bacterium GW2011_GWC2_31_9]KKP33974.1 MAG: hypothetical protein UR24_C0001G0039 [Candidatus Woesebacteria b